MNALQTDEPMVHASLFSGIGGFDLAAEWAGWTNAFNCEIDKFCQKVLKYHFPKTKQYADITTTDFTEWSGRIDVLTGGFPCQPFSLAGKRLGTNDNRYLWPEMLRAIREISPRWIVGENVYGLVNWSDGLVLETVCSDLENEGYEVQPFIIPACAVGAPHRRDRIWIIAHADRYRCGERSDESKLIRKCIRATDYCIDGQDEAASDTKGARFPTRTLRQGVVEFRRNNSREFRGGDFEQFPTKSPVCCGDDGLSDRLDAITFPAWRRESIKAFGNAIVPQVAYRIFETINEIE